MALFALLLQVFAPLSPMPAMRITTAESLVLALSDLCRPGEAPSDKGDNGSGHGLPCQICLTLAVTGHFLAPSVPPLVLPAVTGVAAWQTSPLEARVFAHAVGVQPRGPPNLI
ncbi:DUF2946 family protein [Zavarzinia aquatilis]|uniref:DUF2946 domain-containing protein n=1 Tax=Zavarzinia aquatilis TaxID=2211142 RepID=A0A317EFR4_9PROT|nr:DUF2946 family protein [Zavarzinia aquatilis]PWR25857.1 hypothetical protein DKG74_02585 [Zavarzinia aquatilis]